MKIDGRDGTKAEIFYDPEAKTIELHVRNDEGEWSTCEFSLGKSKQFRKAWDKAINAIEEC
jgi:hypothetical protein